AKNRKLHNPEFTHRYQQKRGKLATHSDLYPALATRTLVYAVAMFFVIPPVTTVLAQLPHIAETFKWIYLDHSSSVFTAGHVMQTNTQIFVSVIVWVFLPIIYGFIRIPRVDIS
ncbi:MAG: hypothetical protein Q3962_08065, partial [Corynebacterium sp.]|nr:hypothetical protein [Corynebacterium sp.]